MIKSYNFRLTSRSDIALLSPDLIPSGPEFCCFLVSFCWFLHHRLWLEKWTDCLDGPKHLVFFQRRLSQIYPWWTFLVGTLVSLCLVVAKLPLEPKIFECFPWHCWCFQRLSSSSWHQGLLPARLSLWTQLSVSSSKFLHYFVLFDWKSLTRSCFCNKLSCLSWGSAIFCVVCSVFPFPNQRWTRNW